jgi:hypothetical protein
MRLIQASAASFAVLATLAASTPSSAAVIRLPVPSVAPPALTLGGVVYGVPDGNRGVRLRYAGGEQSADLARFGPTQRLQSVVDASTYDASPDGRVVWAAGVATTPVREPGAASEQVFAGRISAPLDALTERTACGPAGLPAASAAAVSDLTLAYGICQFQQAASLTVQDPSGTRQVPRDRPGTVRAAGGFIAWAAATSGSTQPNSVIVVDEVGVPQAQMTAPSGAITDFDIQANGSVAYSTDAEPSVIYLQGLGEATPRSVATGASTVVSLSLESDAVLYLARRGSDERFIAQVALRTSDGSTAVLDRDASLVTPVDLDHTRAAWVRPACRDATMIIMDRTTPTKFAHRPPRCGLLLAAPPKLRAGTIQLYTDCTGYSWDDVSCRQLVQALDPHNGKLLGRGRARYVAGQQSTRIRLNRAGRRYVATGARRVRFTITGRAFNGDLERRTGVTTLSR